MRKKVAVNPAQFYKILGRWGYSKGEHAVVLVLHREESPQKGFFNKEVEEACFRYIELFIRLLVAFTSVSTATGKVTVFSLIKFEKVTGYLIMAVGKNKGLSKGGKKGVKKKM